VAIAEQPARVTSIAEQKEDVVGDPRDHRGLGAFWTRREAVAMGLSLASGTLAAGPVHPAAASPRRQATPVTEPPGDQAEAIVALARETMTKYDLKAVILRVTIDGQDIVTTALGESMTGVPATPQMRFRNGAVAYAYLSTLLLRFVDQGLVGLDDALATWLPDLPDAVQVTLRMVTNNTAGYPDYVQNNTLLRELGEHPFRQWTNQELIEIGLSTPRLFAPGTNWDYSHTNFVILAEALAKIGGKPLDVLMQEQVLGPMGLRSTVASSTPSIPEPALHAFSSERRPWLGIPPGTRFYEESTYWNPSWTVAEGLVQTTDIVDVATTMAAVGEGTILSPASHQAQISPDMLGFGTPIAGCAECRTLNEQYNYGLGVVLHGDWILQNPLFSGYAAIGAYYPPGKLAVAVATTFGEGSFDDQGNYTSGWQSLFEAIGALLAPEAMPSSR
jgi:CubicO group peptidase (beta-lactamase class C family)